MSEQKEHLQYDAILMSLSAIAVLANIRYQIWRNCDRLARQTGRADKTFYRDCCDKDSAVLQRLCELLNEAMQFIGDANNNTDAVDDFGMTNASFAAMDRALAEQPSELQP